MYFMAESRTENERLLQLAAAGDGAAWGKLLTEHHDRLCRMVEFRLDRRLRGRVDASDVVQEAYLQAATHRSDYFRDPLLPLFLWLRGVVANKLLEVHRHHLGSQMRDAAREISGCAPAAAPDATSAALIDQLTGGATGPGTAAGRSEVRLRLREALKAMDAMDREVLALRHFEQLTNGEAAQVLGIQERAAAKRYVRALQRLKEILSEMPGGLTEMRP
jgi:RNA polymerase sigma-70 factor (ECF subfamily)